jgi:transcription elongation factor Elf1
MIFWRNWGIDLKPERILSNLPESIREKIRRHAEGTQGLTSRALDCHFCKHVTIIVYEDSSGYVQAKCKKCGEESLYNLMLRRASNYWCIYN